MAIFPKRVGIGAALRDLRDFVAAPRPHKIVFVTASIAAPVGLYAALLQQARVDTDYIPPDIVYVQQWDANRSIDEVKAQQAIDLPAEIAEKKRIADLKEERRKQFERVANVMDDLGL